MLSDDNHALSYHLIFSITITQKTSPNILLFLKELLPNNPLPYSYQSLTKSHRDGTWLDFGKNMVLVL